MTEQQIDRPSLADAFKGTGSGRDPVALRLTTRGFRTLRRILSLTFLSSSAPLRPAPPR